MKVKDFLVKVPEDEQKVIISHHKPGNELCGITVPPITEWRFCDVYELSGSKRPDLVKHVLTLFSETTKTVKIGPLRFTYRKRVKVTDKKILYAKAKKFVALLKYLETEFEKLRVLFQQLEREPDPDMMNAGISSLNKFGSTGIYYAITKDPREWDGLSEVKFGVMYTKMLLDKEHSEIQDRYSKIQADKQNRRK